MKKFSINWKNKSLQSIIIIFGPTAVGKTQVITALGEYNIEIINADSMQVYKYMDIGTAKPERTLRKKIPHHLIDIADPSRQFNAGNFVEMAEALIDGIAKRQNLPVICGGTAYYIRSFIYGLPPSPPGNPEIRMQVRNEFQQKGREALYKELKEADPVSAAKININDSYRIQRALEIIKSSGKPLSAYHIPQRPRTDYRMLLLGLLRERQELYTRIEDRVEEMFTRGLAAEIKRLVARGYNEHDPGMRGIGYKEFFQMQKDCCTLAEVKKNIKRHSKQYAKRQLTFFKSIPGVQWIAADDISGIENRMRDFLLSGSAS